MKTTNIKRLLIISILLISCGEPYSETSRKINDTLQCNYCRNEEKLRWMSYHVDTVQPKILEIQTKLLLRVISIDSAFRAMVMIANDATPFYK